MANDETRAAGNFKERFSYPKDATMRVVRQLEGELDEARAELDRLRAANAELAGAINAPLWLVWSNEHRAWWGPNGRNYYWGIESAGRYTLAEAQKICGMRGVERGNGINPPELVQPSPELIAMWDAALARHDAGKGGGE